MTKGWVWVTDVAGSRHAVNVSAAVRMCDAPGTDGTIIIFRGGDALEVKEAMAAILDAAHIGPEEMGRPYRGGIA